MLSGPSIETWSIWVLFGIFSAPETILLLSSATTWSSQVIVDVFSSGKAIGSLRRGTLLESLLLLLLE